MGKIDKAFADSEFIKDHDYLALDKTLKATDPKLTFTYSKAFELLSEAVKFTNSSKMLRGEGLEDKIFEPEEKLDITGQTEHLYAQRPIWLPW